MPALHQVRDPSHKIELQPSLDAARRVLIVIDSAPAAETMRNWLESPGAVLDAEAVILLATVPRPDLIRTRGILIGRTRRHLRDTGRSRLAPLQSILDRAGIAHEDRVVLAEDAGSVIRVAQETRCGLIVMAAALPTPARRRWISATGLSIPSGAAQVAELAECPVLVLKHGCH